MRVGAYPPNRLGLCDMHGNIGQWSDERDNGVYKIQLITGGSWSSIDSSLCRAAYRHANAATFRSNGVGFRLARVRLSASVPRPAGPVP
jgi:formylglycine-generating enzyme required for sulfatase activity